MKTYIDKLFDRIENTITLKLDCFDSLIAKGEIFLAEEKFCETKKHLNEIISDREKWENRVNSFLNEIEKRKFAEDEIFRLGDDLANAYEKGMIKVAKRNKTELVSVSIGGENVELNRILDRINLFEKNAIEVFVPRIDMFLNDIEDDVNKENREYEVWIDMYNSLVRERTSIINMEETVVEIRNNFLHN